MRSQRTYSSVRNKNDIGWFDFFAETIEVSGVLNFPVDQSRNIGILYRSISSPSRKIPSYPPYTFDPPEMPISIILAGQCDEIVPKRNSEFSIQYPVVHGKQFDETGSTTMIRVVDCILDKLTIHRWNPIIAEEIRPELV